MHVEVGVLAGTFKVHTPWELRAVEPALFDHVESLEYQRAHIMAAGLLIFSFILLAIMYSFNRPRREDEAEQPA